MAEYIEREKAINEVLSCFDVEDSIFSDATVMAIGFKIKDIPAADVQPVKHGWWGGKFPVSRCSICDATMILGDYGNYCPNCGAKMDGET